VSILVIDCGTSSCRVVEYAAADRRRVCEWQAPMPEAMFSAGEVDVEPLWHIAAGLLREASRESPGRIDAVGAASFLAFVLLDGDQRVIAPATTWMDHRAGHEARILADRLTPRGCHRACGRIPTPELLLPKLMWLGRQDPGLLGRVRRVIGLKEEFVRRLGGKVGTDYAHADYSLGWETGCAAPFAGSWEAAGVPSSILPQPEPAWAGAGTVSPEAAAVTGLRAGTPIARGTTDGTSAMYGGGVFDPAFAVLVSGTTDVLMCHVPDGGPVDRLTLTVNTAMAGAGTLVGGAMGLSGGALSWIGRLTGVPVDELERMAAEVPAGSEGLRMIPSLTGERAPFWQDGVKGALLDLDPSHTPGHLARACMEGAAARVRLLADEMRASGLPFRAVTVGGGSSGSLLWNRFRADALQVPVYPAQDKEMTARGIALFCAAMLEGSAGRPQSLAALTRDWVHREEPVIPDPASVGLYQDLAGQYRRYVENRVEPRRAPGNKP
jgi:sugar (pentulose or hexulose) kinase